jgi:hypothetical protein
MYICTECGNDKYFIEWNTYKTHLTFEAGEVVSSGDEYVECSDVYCQVCDALLHTLYQ